MDDLIEGIWRLLNSDHVEPVNIGNPSEMTVLQFAHEIIRLTGSASELVFRDLPVNDPKVRQPDISLARTILDWEPSVALEDGLATTIGFFAGRQ